MDGKKMDGKKIVKDIKYTAKQISQNIMIRGKETKSAKCLIPLRLIESGHFQKDDNSYVDLIRVVPPDLMNSSDQEIDYVVILWTQLYRVFGNSIKIISLNTATDTAKQQEYINYKISKNKNPVFDEILKEKLEELKEVQRTKRDRQHYIMYFGKDLEEINRVQEQLNTLLIRKDLAENISLELKVELFKKINNKTMLLNNIGELKSKGFKPSQSKEKKQQKEKLDKELLRYIQPIGGLSPINERYNASGSGYEACITITKFPTQVDSFWLADIMNIADTVATIDIATEDMAVIKKNINDGIKEQDKRANQAEDTPDYMEASTRMLELQYLWKNVMTMGEVIKLLRIKIFVAAPSYYECDQKVNEVILDISALGYEATVNINESITDFKSIYQSYEQQQETQETKLYARYGQPMQSEALADGIPFYFINLQDECGTLFGYSAKGDGCVLFDPYAITETRNSYDMIIAGKKGSGKSTTIKKLIKDIAARNNFLRILDADPDEEYRTIVEYLGGSYITFDGKSGTVNMFQIFVSDGDNEATAFISHVAKLRIIYQLNNKDVTQKELNLFEEYLQEFYIKCGLINPEVDWSKQNITDRQPNEYPILEDFVNFLYEKLNSFEVTNDKIKDNLLLIESVMCQTIHSFYSNLLKNYGYLLNGYTSISNLLNNQIVCFGIASLKNATPELFDSQLFLLLTLFWSNCVKLGRIMKRKWENKEINWWDIQRFQIIVDESHRIVNENKPEVVKKVTDYAREGRRYFGGITLASQSIRDYTSESNSAAFEQIKILFELCDYKMMMNQDTGATELMRNLLGNKFSDSDLDAIPKFGKGDMILCLPGEKNIRLNVQITEQDKEMFKGGA